jgi:hypothetical protein
MVESDLMFLRECSYPLDERSLGNWVLQAVRIRYRELTYGLLTERGVRDLTETSSSNVLAMKSVWHPSLKALIDVAQSECSDKAKAGALEVAAVSTLGLTPPSKREVVVIDRKRVTFDRFCLPAARVVRYCGDDATFRIEGVDGSSEFEICFARSDLSVLESSVSESVFARDFLFGAERTPYVFGKELVDIDTALYPAKEARGDDIGLSSLREAYAILDEYCEEYGKWVRNVIFHLRPIISPNNEMISGSNISRPGEVEIAINVAPIRIAEMLVHEASHQYIYVVLLAGKKLTRNGGEFYNPVLKRERPVDKIFLALHAFVNTERFIVKCLESGYNEYFLAKNYLVSLRAEINELLRPFLSHSCLTDVGQEVLRDIMSQRSAIN